MNCVGAKYIYGVFNLWIALFSSLNAQDRDRDSTILEMPPQVYEKVEPVTVRITNEEDKVGSGVIIGIDTSSLGNIALILTACHVIASNYKEAADQFEELRFYTDIKVNIFGESLPLPAIVDTGFIDYAIDIAILKIYVSDSIDQVIQYNETINPGQIVAAVGYPGTKDLRLTVGIIESKEKIEGNFYVFDAKIDKGNSGGPLVDNEGNMVGMNIYKVGTEGNARKVNLLATVVNNWFENKPIIKFWGPAKDSFWKKMYTNPLFIGAEAVIVGGVLYLLLRSPAEEDPIFGSPPNPP